MLRFRYYFKLHRGGSLRYGVGTDAADAALDAGLDMREVKRCMPVAVVEDEKTPEEVERLRATRLAALAKARAVRAAEREIEQQIERRKVKQ